MDDDALLLSAMNRLLRHGFDVRLATSVAEGLAEVEQLGRVDLAFVDFELPDGTGEVVLRALERWPDAIRVLMSGNIRKIDELRRCGSLVPLVLQKPLCTASVTAAVRAALKY